MSSENCNKTLGCLIKNNIKLICIDFDNTLVSVHTYGKWDESASQLSNYVRPDIEQLINKCLKQNIHVGIVTYSSQHELVNNVLEIVFGQNANKIFVRTSDMKYNFKNSFCSTLIKQNELKMERKIPMIVSIMFDIYNNTNKLIPVKSVLLIDDDWNNIKTAKNAGFYTYHYTNNSDKVLYNQLQSLEGFNKPVAYTFIFADICKIVIILLYIIYAIWYDRTNKKYGIKLQTIKTESI